MERGSLFTLDVFRLNKLQAIPEEDEEDVVPRRRESNVSPMKPPIIKEDLSPADSSPNLKKLKRSNSMKSTSGVPSEFPVLVRGIDIENASLKLIRGENPSESPKQQVEISDNETEEFKIEENPNIYNIPVLKSLLTLQEAPPKQLLEQAINDHGEIPPVSKEGFWSKMFKERKKEGELLVKAHEEWVKTDDEVHSVTQEYNEKKALIESLTQNKSAFNDTYKDLRSNIQVILSSITDQKMAGMVEYEQLLEDIEDARDKHENVKTELEDTKLSFNKRLEQTKEREEIWRMNIEDSLSSLVNLSIKRLFLSQKVDKNQKTLRALEEETHKFKGLRAKTKTAVGLLEKILDFYQKKSGFSALNEEFLKALKQVKRSSYEAIEAEQEFAYQATTDPKEIIYYSRGGNYSKRS